MKLNKVRLVAEDGDEMQEESLATDVKNIVGGVATIVLIVVPIIIIRKLVRRIENSETYKTVENTIG